MRRRGGVIDTPQVESSPEKSVAALGTEARDSATTRVVAVEIARIAEGRMFSVHHEPSPSNVTSLE